jgi:hypothetical protein
MSRDTHIPTVVLYVGGLPLIAYIAKTMRQGRKGKKK